MSDATATYSRCVSPCSCCVARVTDGNTVTSTYCSAYCIPAAHTAYLTSAFFSLGDSCFMQTGNETYSSSEY